MAAKVLAVQTGFLVGNLFDGWIEGTDGIDLRASAERYADLLHDELSARYPTATIDVNYQDGVGSLPYDCKTRIDVSDDDNAWEVQRAEEEMVDVIGGDLYTRLGDNGAYVWIVSL
jgi:hypothetical protein